MTGILMLESLTRGNTLKQGDKTPLTYKLLDADGDNLNVAGKTATVRLVHPNYLTIGYEKTGLTVQSDDTVTFTIDTVIQARKYHVEIIVDNKFVFPSRSVESEFTIDKSSLGTEANIIEIVGKEVLINTVKSQVDTELQPLVTSLQAAEQAEAQRASAESSRASAEEQREIDHANRSAEMAGKADKVVLNNINGTALSDFTRATGMSNFSNGKITMSPTTSGVVSQIYWDIGKLDEGDSIYVFSEAEYQDPEVENVGITLKLGGVGITTSSSYFTFNGSGNHEVSDIFKATQITDSFRVYIEQNFNNSLLPDVITHLSKVVIVNLTEMFGSGNEPTKEEMDELVNIAEYNDGEYALSNKEILGYLMRIRENADIDEDKLINKIIANASDIKTLNEKYSSIMHRVNMFNKDNMIEGGYYNRLGNWVNPHGYNSSEFIPVEGGKTYLTSGSTSASTSAYVLWDENKDYISGELSYNNIPTTTETKFITVAVLLEDKDNVMITLEGEMPDEYVPYTKKIMTFSDEWSSQGVIKNKLEIARNASDIKTLNEKYSSTIHRVNIFNKDNMMVGGLYNRFGEWSRSVGYLSSEFIPVEGGKTYLTSGRVGAHVLWDENKDYISGTLSSKIIPTTTETKFITVAILVEDKDNVMITLEGDMPDEYVPYDYTIPKSDRLEGRIEDMINESVSTVGNFSNKLSSNYTEPINLPVDDFSGYNQPYHPSVIYIEGGFQGYEYWLTQSPFPVGGKPRANRWEMPIVYKSHDGIDWINVADPLDDLTEQDIVDGNFFSDPHILFREDTQTLEVWYRFTDRSGDKSLTGIYRKTTTDGSTWTDREELFEPNLSYQEDSIRSHSVIWDNENKIYRLWFQNEFNDGVHYRTSPDGHNWGEQEPMILDIRHSGIWHIDVNYYNNQYHLISYSSTEQNLVYYVSEDNKNYHRQRTILDMKDGHPLYAGGLYRSISMLDGDGKVRLYFSGDNEDNRRGINVLIADNLYEMNGVQKIDGNNVVISDNGMTLNDLAIELQHIKKNQ